MRISSNTAEYQINEFLKVLKKSKIKKGSEEWVRHLVMLRESQGVLRGENGSVDWDEYLHNWVKIDKPVNNSSFKKQSKRVDVLWIKPNIKACNRFGLFGEGYC